MRTQSPAFVAEEVFPDLGFADLLEVGVVAVDAAAGFVELDDRDGLILWGFVVVEAANHVAVEAFGAKGDYNVN